MKHLNPRQGITTRLPLVLRCSILDGVKHLNPRQGITTGASSKLLGTYHGV